MNAAAKVSDAEAEIAFLKLMIEKLRRELYGWYSERKSRLLDQLPDEHGAYLSPRNSRMRSARPSSDFTSHSKSPGRPSSAPQAGRGERSRAPDCGGASAPSIRDSISAGGLAYSRGPGAGARNIRV